MNKVNLKIVDKVFIVIRSVGERTESLCYELLVAQGFPKKNISLIRISPFSNALRTAYEIGISANLPWTFCLDADVLLLPGTLAKLIHYAENLDQSVVEVRGLVLDKFFGGPRQAGNHLYRTSLLPKAIDLISNDDIRPEQNALERMKAAGHPWKRIDLIIGLHDFEQYFRDIFRKCFIQAHKHQEYAEIFVTYWPQQMSSDPDYFIALEGYKAGLGFKDNVQIDNRQSIYNEKYQILNYREKTEIQPDLVQPDNIKKMFSDWQQPPVYQKYFQYNLLSGEYRSLIIDKIWASIKKKRDIGLLQMPFYIIGWGLEKIGNLLKNLFGRSYQ